jgi:exodeoxyribonuclease VII small subunit
MTKGEISALRNEWGAARLRRRSARSPIYPPAAYNGSAMARKNQPAPKNFEEALAELEAILADIEGGEVPLEESLVKYERGQFLVQHCRTVLAQAEKQIEQLSKGPDGESLQATPMPETAEDE